MNSRQIDCVLELAKVLNFNRAAENLFLSQPTLTYHIRSIEEEIGFEIFQRSGRGAVLTPPVGNSAQRYSTSARN